MPPAGLGEVLDAIHAAAGEQLRRGNGASERVDEPPVLGQRGIGRGKRTGHHRTGGQHAALPRESLHLPANGRGAAQALDRHGRIGCRRIGLLHVALGLGEHRGHGQVAERRGWQPSEQAGIVGQNAHGQRPRRGQFERHEPANALLHVRRHCGIAAEQDQRVCPKRFECDRDSARHPLVPQRSQPPGRNLPGLMRLGHARHQQGEWLRVARNVAVVVPGDDLRSLHAPPGDHHPRPRRLQHDRLNLGIARLRRRRKPPRGPPGFEQLQLQVHRERCCRAGPRLVIVAVDPPGRREQNASRARRHGCQRSQAEALRIDRQPLSTDA